MGQIKTYPAMKQVIKVRSIWTKIHCRALKTSSEILVLGSLTLAKVLPTALLEQKLKRIFVLDEIFCHEENEAALRARLVDGSGDFTVVPAGFEFVEQALRINSIVLVPPGSKTVLQGKGGHRRRSDDG